MEKPIDVRMGMLEVKYIPEAEYVFSLYFIDKESETQSS